LFLNTKTMNTIKTNLCFFIILFCNFVHASVNTEVFCFSSSDKKPINMEVRLYFDTNAKWSGGFVKYENATKPISIFLNKDDQYADDNIDKWLEVLNGKITGTYMMSMRGLPSVTYKNYSHKKKFYFLFNSNVEGSPEKGCQW
jgi:hypothetical protein